FSIHASSGIKNAGKYLAFTETGTRNSNGLSTGIDHIRELGVTHVHLLPVFDFTAINETKLHEPQYNWGYDPLNYNVPEGSYSTDPYNGKVRIKEFKQMVQTLHRQGIRVIMDVVYNHVNNAAESHFEHLVPGYFFRTNPNGSFSNGSGCGNETASERPMVRKYIIESLKYWASEYHIDGFRFDLMGLHDIETMNLIREELDKIDPTIFLYGEGWTAGESPLPLEKRALKSHTKHLNRIAVFSDDIRDAIRGHWAHTEDSGFMAGKRGFAESIRSGVIASTNHPQINYKKVNYSNAPWAGNPMQTITYVTCHDNPCLWDKIVYTCKECSQQDKLDIQKLANAITLTCQGISFLHAGEEIVRTKIGEHNSYNLPDSVNQLIWTNKALYYDVFCHYRDLIALRKNHPAFRMTSSEMISKHLSFIETGDELLVGFRISGYANNDSWKEIIVYYNAHSVSVMQQLPARNWKVVANKYEVNEAGVRNQGYGGIFRTKILIPARSVMILVDEESVKT
ncbi:MAG TPA: type I pullulanase, partial [Bacteroidales bacterium]|nr:type I pullulanase [Bacteroidales bacterium]